MTTFKNVLQLDADGVFVGHTQAHESPLEPGVFLMPAGTLDLPAPEVPAGQIARWVDGSWVFYVLPTEEPGDDGEPVEEDPLTIPEMRERVWGKIKTERDRRKAAGVKVGAHWFHSDDSSRIQQMALVMLGAAMPAGLNWKTLTHFGTTFVTMTPALAGQIFQATVMSDAAIFSHAEQLRMAVEFSETPEQEDISNWPTSFEDEA